MLEAAAWNTLRRADILVEEELDGVAFSLYEPIALWGYVVPWLKVIGLCFCIGSMLSIPSIELGIVVMGAGGVVLLLGLLAVLKELVVGGLRGAQHARVRLQLTQHALIWNAQRIPWSSVDGVEVVREQHRYALNLTVSGKTRALLYQDEERLLEAFQALINEVNSIAGSTPEEVPEALLAIRTQAKPVAAQRG
jgi:hypothetical protein